MRAQGVPRSLRVVAWVVVAVTAVSLVKGAVDLVNHPAVAAGSPWRQAAQVGWGAWMEDHYTLLWALGTAWGLFGAAAFVGLARGRDWGRRLVLLTLAVEIITEPLMTYVRADYWRSFWGSFPSGPNAPAMVLAERWVWLEVGTAVFWVAVSLALMWWLTRPGIVRAYRGAVASPPTPVGAGKELL